MYVRTGPDDFVDISIVFMDTGGAPGGAPFDGRLWVRTAPFIELCCGIILSGDGGHADGQQYEGEDALHGDDELLRSGKLENLIEKKLRFIALQ